MKLYKPNLIWPNEFILITVILIYIYNFLYSFFYDFFFIQYCFMLLMHCNAVMIFYLLTMGCNAVMNICNTIINFIFQCTVHYSATKCILSNIWI